MAETDRLKVIKADTGPGLVDFHYEGFDYDIFLGVIKSEPGNRNGECYARWDDDWVLRTLKEQLELKERRRWWILPKIKAARLKRTLKDLDDAWDGLLDYIVQDAKTTIKSIRR